MTEDRMHTYHAGILARYLTETLFRADSIKRYAGQDASHYFARADEQLKELANHLGFDLVKREEKQEAA